jgi:hypothetical protein
MGLPLAVIAAVLLPETVTVIAIPETFPLLAIAGGQASGFSPIPVLVLAAVLEFFPVPILPLLGMTPRRGALPGRMEGSLAAEA